MINIILIYTFIMIKCINCSNEIMYSKKDIDYNFSCTKCGNKYKYYASKINFKQESIELDFNNQNNSPKYSSIQSDGLDGGENWGVDG